MTAQSHRTPQLWEKKLQERGIFQEAVDHGWQPNGSGWTYPVYDDDGKPFVLADGRKVERWKNFDSNASPKYCWHPKDAPDRPKYYLLPGTIGSIRVDCGGGAYLVSGEPDVLALRAAGIYNALCWFGEQSKPDTLADDLKSFGVTVVDIFPDLDRAGDSWAAWIASTLQGSGINVRAYQLPAELGEKGDLNKLWIACNFDPDDFSLRLINLPEREIKPTADSRPNKPALQVLEHQDLPAGFYAAIEAALANRGVKGYKAGDGWSNNIACPMADHEHDGKQPGFGWNRLTKIGKCFKCGDHILAKDVGAALGLDWHNYTERRPALDVRQAAQDGTKPAPRKRFEWFTRDDDTEDLATVWLSKDILAEKSYTLLYGDSRTCKSAWATTVGMEVSQQGHDVVMVMGEGVKSSCKDIDACKRAYGYSSKHFHYLKRAINFSSKDECNAFIEDVKANFPNVRLIIFDTLVRGLPGKNLKDIDIASMVADFAHRLIDELGATPVFIGHTGKNAASGAFGSVDWTNSADTVLKMTKSGAAYSLEVQKQRGEEEGQRFTYSRKVVVVGVTEEGKDITGLVMEPTEPEGRAVSLSKNLSLVLNTIRDNPGINQAELVRKTGLVRQTIVNLTKQLVAEGLIDKTEDKWPGYYPAECTSVQKVSNCTDGQSEQSVQSVQKTLVLDTCTHPGHSENSSIAAQEINDPDVGNWLRSKAEPSPSGGPDSKGSPQDLRSV